MPVSRETFLFYTCFNTMRYWITACLFFFFVYVRASGSDSLHYAVERNMPVFYKEMKSQLTFPLARRNAGIKSFGRWKKKARAMLENCLYNFSEEPDSFAFQITDSLQREGFTAYKVEFNISKWCRVPAYLLVPQGKGPFPALVALHDHGAHFSIGKEKVVRPFHVSNAVRDDADKWNITCYDGQYPGDYFAAHGYVVLAVDALLWGERGNRAGPDYNVQQALAGNFLQMGSSWASFIAMDDVRSVDFLASLPFVDKKRVGCVGFSMGAYRSWMLSALSDKVKASAAICWINTTNELMTLNNNQNRGGSAYAMLVPGLVRYMDYADVASLACPKPALFFNGTRDKLFPVKGVEDAYYIMRNVWKEQGADDRLITKFWDEKHFYNVQMQRETLQFFDKWLKR